MDKKITPFDWKSPLLPILPTLKLRSPFITLKGRHVIQKPMTNTKVVSKGQKWQSCSLPSFLASLSSLLIRWSKERFTRREELFVETDSLVSWKLSFPSFYLPSSFYEPTWEVENRRFRFSGSLSLLFVSWTYLTRLSCWSNQFILVSIDRIVLHFRSTGKDYVLPSSSSHSQHRILRIWGERLQDKEGKDASSRVEGRCLHDNSESTSG
jgi:hypothetical protein